jgi:hypothetical protein
MVIGFHTSVPPKKMICDKCLTSQIPLKWEILYINTTILASNQHVSKGDANIYV